MTFVAFLIITTIAAGRTADQWAGYSTLDRGVALVAVAVCVVGLADEGWQEITRFVRSTRPKC